MKKFLCAVALLACGLMALGYAVFYRGFYVNFAFGGERAVTADFRAEGKTLLARNSAGEWQPLTIRGVELSSAVPGHHITDYAAGEETYYRWLTQISEMGANTVRIPTIYDAAFYNAFYRFNTESGLTLYLLQGLSVTDHANNSLDDAYADEFYGALREDSLAAIDVIHGRRILMGGDGKGGGAYWRDVSPWVLGFLIGNEWDAGTVAYTDHTTANPTSFDGAYFATTPEASAFETLLARLMDGMATYEAEKYGQQRLLAFINDPLNDPFAYETFYARQLGKYSCIDAEHIRPTKAFASGYFAAYSVSASFPDFSQYLSAGQRSALGEALAELDTERFGNGYVQLLNAYHTMPVLVASYGFSTARGTVSTEGPLNEQEQGERLVAAYEDFLSAGCAGAVVSTWQDVWTRRTWNTSYAVDVYESHRWHDLQSAGQSSGLLAFAPGSEASACVVDGDGSEWTEADVVWQADGLSLSVRQDAEGLYLLVRGEGVSPQAALYIPIDVTPLSGATQSAQPSLRFARGADFLLCLSGAEDSRLLVQARYEALRENYLASTSGEDPFADPPAADSSLFVPIGMVTERTGVLTEEEAAQAEGAPLLPVYETGRLRQGTLDPADAAYDSLADFFYGDGLVEVRLPWQLLNFYSPAGAQVHADYYQHYGVEPLRIESIYLGVGLGETAEEISMSAYKLETWQQPTYRERLKAAYWMLQESWGGGDAD